MREMQSRIILHTTVLPLVALTILTVAVTILCRQVIAEASALDVAVPKVQLLLVTVVCLTSTMAGAILYIAFRFSNRVAGPSYRLIQSLKRARTGDADFRVKLRDGDFLTEVADELNLMLKSMAESSAPQANDPPGETGEPAARQPAGTAGSVD